MKKAYSFIVILIVMILVPPINTFAIMKKLSMEELTILSHTIVRGEVTKVWSEYASPDTKGIITLVAVHILEGVKGPLKQEIILVIPGGTVGDLGLYIEDTPQFIEGEEIIVFITDDYKERPTLTGWRQGKFKIENEKSS